jgi:hypothetical protein
MQHDQGSPSLNGVSDLSIGREAPGGDRGLRAGCQHLFHRVGTGSASEAHVADGGDFPQMQRGVFGVEVHDGLAHGWRETARGLIWRIRHLGEEAQHATLIKLVRLVPQRPFTCPGLSGPLRRGIAEEEHGAQNFIDLLLRPQRVLLDLVPILGMGTPRACDFGHSKLSWTTVISPQRLAGGMPLTRLP